jgi:hypothetical protein
MKKINGKKRLTLLAILAGIAYLLLIGTNVMNGLRVGNQNVRFNHESLKVTGSVSNYEVPLMPKYEQNINQNSILNLKTGKKIVGQIFQENTIWGYLSSNTPKSAFIIGYTIIEVISVLIIFIILIYIPILFYKLLYSIVKDTVFTKELIRKIRRLAVLLFIVYISALIWQLSLFEINTTLFQFVNYDIVFANPSMIWLFMGVLALLIAEIIARGSELKEEQELTI